MSVAAAATGGPIVSPTILLDEPPAPTGPAAARAWDAVRVLLTEPGFVELGPPRTPHPAPAARPPWHDTAGVS